MGAACRQIDLGNWSAARMIDRTEQAYARAIHSTAPLSIRTGVAYAERQVS
jgi:hypothetical protein